MKALVIGSYFLKNTILCFWHIFGLQTTNFQPKSKMMSDFVLRIYKTIDQTYSCSMTQCYFKELTNTVIPTIGLCVMKDVLTVYMLTIQK